MNRDYFYYLGTYDVIQIFNDVSSFIQPFNSEFVTPSKVAEDICDYIDERTDLLQWPLFVCVFDKNRNFKGEFLVHRHFGDFGKFEAQPTF